MPLPFEQQPRETSKAFAAFSAYLSLGPERTLSGAGNKVGKCTRLMEQWSRKYEWVGRARAYSAHLAVVEREAGEALARAKGVDWFKRQIEQREEEWKVRCELLENAREALQRFKESGRIGSLEGIARLLELASKLGRLSSGMPADRTEITGQDRGPFRIEVEAALKKIYGQPEVLDIEAKELPGHEATKLTELPTPVLSSGERVG